jgi:hypothetical protein
MKTSELTGAALDWAVAKCDGWEWKTGKSNLFGNKPYLERKDKNGTIRRLLWEREYSTNWAQGGPIIEREGISTAKLEETLPDAMVPHPTCWSGHIEGIFVRYGPTPLIAAMRCYVASKLGEDVSIPEELKK